MFFPIKKKEVKVKTFFFVWQLYLIDKFILNKKSIKITSLSLNFYILFNNGDEFRNYLC